MDSVEFSLNQIIPRPRRNLVNRLHLKRCRHRCWGRGGVDFRLVNVFRLTASVDLGGKGELEVRRPNVRTMKRRALAKWLSF